MKNELLFMTIFLTPGEWSFSLASGRAPFRQKVWIPVFEEWHSATGFCARQGRCGAFSRRLGRAKRPRGRTSPDSNLPETWVVLLGRVPLLPGHRSGETLDEAESVIQKEPR